MADRKTELGIENLNPEDLGELGSIIEPSDNIPDSPDCFLISYLTSPITKNSSNTYVVFLKSDELKKNVESYHWKVSLELDIGSLAPLSVDYDPELPIFKYEFLSGMTVIIDVDLKDKDEKILRTLQIRQKCREPYEALERLLKHSQVEIDGEIETHNAALGAHPETSREVLNDLYPYIKSAYESSEETNKVPFNFLAAIVYLQVFRVPKERASGVSWASLRHMTSFANRFREEELENVIQVFNGENSWSFGSDIYNSIGITQISPQTLAMIVDDPESDPNGEILPPPTGSDEVQTKDYTTYIKWTPLPADEDQREKIRDIIEECYEEKLSSDKQIRLFNLLRFPKSNIKQCFDLLNFLKNRPNRFPDLSTKDFAGNKEAIKLIATEFQIGGTESTFEKAKSNKFGKSVARIMNSPIFTIGFGGELDIKSEGTVEDETSSSISMKGAKVHVYRTMLDIFSKRPCFISEDRISATAADSDYITIKGYKITDLNIPGLSEELQEKIKPLLNKHYKIENDFLIILKHLLGVDLNAHKNAILTSAETDMEQEVNHISCPVLAVKRSFTIAGNSNYDIIKIKIDSPKLDYNEGWVISRYYDTFYAKLVSKRDDNVTEVDDDNKFSFNVYKYQPYFIRVVKEPDGINGYFDGEITEEIEDLPLGWFLPPKNDILINMEPAKYMVSEEQFLNNINIWKNYKYSSTVIKPGTEALPNPVKAHAIKYPPDFHVNDVVGLADWIVPDGKEIDCCTFVEANVVESWHNIHPKHNWGKSQHAYAMPYGGLDKFSPVWIHMSRLIIVKTNPNGDSTITIKIGRESVEAKAAIPVNDTQNELKKARRLTAKRIYEAINANDDITNEIRPIYENDNLETVVLRPLTIGNDLDVSIICQYEGGNIAIVPKDDECIFPVKSIDISDDNKKPPHWLLVQGWHTNIKGHTFFIIDNQFDQNKEENKIGKVLRLESNSARNLDGPGFGSMGVLNGNVLSHTNDSGDIDKQIVNKKVVANKDLHWTDKVTNTWKDVKKYYNHTTDDINPFGAARLKIYKLKLSEPKL